MSKISRTIAVKVDIWDTEYKITKVYADGSLSVKVPYTKWEGQNVSLDFCSEKIKPSSSALVRWFFDHDTLVDDNGLALGDIIYGY